MKLSVDQSLRKAASLSARGDVAAAEAIYRTVLDRFPSNKRALDGIRALSAPKDSKAYDKGLEAVLTLYDQGRLREALDHVRLLIDLYPSQPDLHNIAGAACAGTGQFDRAVEAYDRALELRPDYAEVWANRATALIGKQECAAALESCDEALRHQPGNAQAHSNRGIALKHLGRTEEALASYDQAIALLPNATEVRYNRANALFELKRYEASVAEYDRAIALRPVYVGAHSNRGNALKALDRLDEACEAYRRAIALHPGFAEAHSNLGVALLGLGRRDEALQSCRKALELQADAARIHYNLAVVLQEMQQFEEALVHYDRAIQLDPRQAEAHGNRGHVLFQLHRSEEAADAYGLAIALNPEDAPALYSRGNVLQDLGRLDEAVETYRQAVAIAPGYAEAEAQLAYQRARMCDWSATSRPDFAALAAAAPSIPPYTFVALEDEPALHLAHTRRYVAHKHGSTAASPARPAARPSRLRVGYFSAEFHDHAVMFQLARMFELHDPDRFSIHAYSFGPARPSAMRDRLIAAFEGFHDVRGLESREIAERSRADGIDIAVDLMGFTGHARPEILAHRPAPVQIAYMGYPGTLAAPFIDYLIADPTLIPDAQRDHYAEKIIYLPETYQANDDTRQIAASNMSRADLGLPEQGFIFCCFNNSFKITPAEFDIWMRLLAGVESSVLWLLASNQWVHDNLRNEAKQRGIDPDRLVFAGHMPHAEHLARLRHADLFLDCFTCNAHATASDALWAGVPVLTVPGQGLAARVGASVVNAIGLPELVVSSPSAYEQIAVDLAKNPVLLKALRAKLIANRDHASLFNSERFTRHIEAGYAEAYDRYWNGLNPEHIRVARRP